MEPNSAFRDPVPRQGYMYPPLPVGGAGIPYFAKQELLIRIGNLDPVEEISGQVGRLNNLGYFAGDVSQPDPMEFRSAVEEFQCDHSLSVDGICGPNTQAKLKQVHGC